MVRQWLIDIRSAKNMTHEVVAKQSCIQRPYYTQIENGVRRPSVETAQNIAKTLGFDWTKFFEQDCSETRQTHTA